MEPHHVLRQKRRRASATIWLIGLTVLTFIVWASFASVDEIVRANGRVVPASRPQVIQNLEGGILAELLVAEGDIVEKGQVLARLHDKQFLGSFDELNEQVIALKIKLLRFEAEARGEEALSLPEELMGLAPQVVKTETALLQARLQDFQAAISSISSTLDLAEKEVAILKPMVERQLVAPIDLLQAEKTVSEIRAQLNTLTSEFALERAREQSDTQSELTKLEQTLKIREDQLVRTVMRSPVRGIVNGVEVTTIGGVVRPGEELLSVIPLDDELLVEAEVVPEDIAFIYPGMPTTAKLTAYDYTIYGSLKGEVEHVSADTFTDETRRDPKPYYKVMVRIPPEELEIMGQGVEIRPGLTVTVEFHSGSRTVMSYLLKPLLKAAEAMREP